MTIPLDDIDRVFVIGASHISSPARTALLRREVPFHFIDSGGQWLGSLTGYRSGNVQRRIHQYETLKKKEKSLLIAKMLLTLKIKNCRRVLQRLASNRDLSQDKETKAISIKLQRNINAVEDTKESLLLSTLKDWDISSPMNFPLNLEQDNHQKTKQTPYFPGPIQLSIQK